MWADSQFPADFVTFTGEIILQLEKSFSFSDSPTGESCRWKLHFLCSVKLSQKRKPTQIYSITKRIFRYNTPWIKFKLARLDLYEKWALQNWKSFWEFTAVKPKNYIFFVEFTVFWYTIVCWVQSASKID